MSRILTTAIIMILLLLPLGSAMAQGSPEDRNALDYLPPSNFIGGYETNGNELFGHLEDVAFMFGDDEYKLLAEYELVWYATETYSNYDNEITIEIFEFPSASDAFGFYSVAPIPYMEPDAATGIVVEPYGLPPVAKIDTIRDVYGKYLEGYKDKFYFRVSKENYSEELTQVGIYLLASLPGASMPADMVALLPGGDRVMGTEKYLRGPEGLSLIFQDIRGDILGFDEYAWKAVAAEYRLGGGEYYLLLIADYDDSESATAARNLLTCYFQDSGWEQLMISPTGSGNFPRAFADGRHIAFWSNQNQIYLLWDLTDMDALMSALRRF